MNIEEGMQTFAAHWHPFVEITQLGRHGIENRESRKLTFGTHTGTHIDAPRHFIPGGQTVDRVPLELCYETDMLGRARTDGNNDGVVACDSGALEYGYLSQEVTVRTTPYWRSVGNVDLSSDSPLFIAVMSGGPIDPTTIVFDSIKVGDFPRSALRGVVYYDKNGDGLPDYNFWYRLDRDLVLECRYYDEPFPAMTDDGLSLAGRLQFEVVGCTP